MEKQYYLTNLQLSEVKKLYIRLSSLLILVKEINEYTKIDDFLIEEYAKAQFNYDVWKMNFEDLLEIKRSSKEKFIIDFNNGVIITGE